MYSIVHSKVSSLGIGESMKFNHDDSQTGNNNSRFVDLVEKQPSIKSRKGFHKSPRIMSPTTVFKSPEKTPEDEIAEFEAKIN